MRVEDLSGALLDYWVFKAEHPQTQWTRADWETQSIPYSVDWRWGGPIIERKRISIKQDAGGGCYAYFDHLNATAFGDTPLIAAMRCYVASTFGEEVPDLAIDAPQVVG